jgi:signal transduction histidine kinase
MHSPDAKARTLRPSSGWRSTSLGPTTLDRLLDRTQQIAPKLTRASDLVVIVVAGLLALVDVALWVTDPVVDAGRLPWSIAFLVPVLGVLATVAVALRRDRVTAALATLAGAGIVLTLGVWIVGTGLPPSFAALFALALLNAAVLRRAPGRTAVVLTVFGVVAVAAESLRPTVTTTAYLLVVCEAAFVVAVGVGVYLRWSDWRRVAAADAARVEERLEIAREMHDMVGHYVSGMVVRAQAARHVAEHRPAEAAAALENIEAAGIDALAAMRQMVCGLRDASPTAPAVTWDDVNHLVASVVAQGQPVRVTIAPDVRATSLALIPSVHRIVAESLTNVRRHARQVTSVAVDVFRHGDYLVVNVRDNGQPTARREHDAFGIVGMRERAASLGGSLIAGPAPGGGWLVHAELPMEHRG